MVVVRVCRAEDGDLVERAGGEPRLDDGPDGGEARRCVDDDQLAHAVRDGMLVGASRSTAGLKRGRTGQGGMTYVSG